jgi:hypothetical protein
MGSEPRGDEMETVSLTRNERKLPFFTSKELGGGGRGREEVEVEVGEGPVLHPLACYSIQLSRR